VKNEPERYELDSPPAYFFDVDRREFVKLFGGGLVILLAIPESVTAQESGARRGADNAFPKDLAAWLKIDEKGAVTVFTGKAEVGQNIRTSLTQAVAEELHVGIDAVTLVMADTDLTPYDMGTFGSRTTPTMAPQLRKAAAVAREMLIDLAAQTWGVPRTGLVAADGTISNPLTGKLLKFEELTKGQKLVKTIDDGTPLAPAAKWTVAGTPVPKIDGRAFVTGEHRYTSDMTRPGMLHAKVLRPPSFGATLASLDHSEAEKMPGVVVVHDAEFLGVAAPTPHEAEKAIDALKATWTTTPQPSGAELFTYLKEHASSEKGNEEPFVKGSIADGMATASKKLEATYTVAYIAHTPLEPRAALAEWRDGKLTVWTGSQRPFGVRSELAKAFHIPEESVRVIVPDTGSAYGGKHTGEAAIEAARLAKAAGKPVKIVWTREEEFTWAYFRPAGVIDVKSGARPDGTLTAWEFHNTNSGTSAIRPLYDIPHQHVEFHESTSPLRQGSYRGLAATANHFARETHLDEMALALKLDPVRMRMKNLAGDPRMRAVLEATAAHFGWAGSKPRPGRGFGIAAASDKGGYVATAAEVSVDRESGQVKVVRLVAAFECGAVVNPDGLKNQVEGALVMGLGGALFEAIQFDAGKILNPFLARYRVPRFADVPAIEVVLLDRKDLPSAGAGETPIMALAPAIGNAIFDAAGVRLRSLPLAPEGVKRERMTS
jgi:isoquinoline 1-oxidoreductase